MNIGEAHRAILSGKIIEHLGYQYKLMEGKIFYSTNNWKSYHASEIFNDDTLKIVEAQEEIDKRHFEKLRKLLPSFFVYYPTIAFDTELCDWLQKKASS